MWCRIISIAVSLALFGFLYQFNRNSVNRWMTIYPHIRNAHIRWHITYSYCGLYVGNCVAPRVLNNLHPCGSPWIYIPLEAKLIRSARILKVTLGAEKVWVLDRHFACLRLGQHKRGLVGRYKVPFRNKIAHESCCWLIHWSMYNMPFCLIRSYHHRYLSPPLMYSWPLPFFERLFVNKQLIVDTTWINCSDLIMTSLDEES